MVILSVRRLAGVAALVAVWCLLIPAPAYASLYGRSNYGECGFQHCASASTQVTLPSGLEVSINVVDGQTIPYNGYTVMVTPLNGRGASFQKVDFYVNDKPAASVLPDGTGTAQWLWNPAQVSGTQLKVMVTGSDGTILTKTFTVRIGSKPDPSPSPADNPRATSSSGIAAVVQRLTNKAADVIRALPRPVVYGFPYVLFVILGMEAGLLLLQARREVREYRTLQKMYARMQTVRDAQKMFLELASHYLRTPLALVRGGIDMLPKNVPSTAGLLAAATMLHNKIEQLVAQVQAAQTPPTAGTPPRVYVWRHPGLVIPPALIGATAFSFTYLTGRAGTFTVTQVTVIVQLVCYAGLTVVLYQTFRRLQLRRRDTGGLRQIMVQEIAVNSSRNALITEAAATLRSDTATIETLSRPLEQSQAVSFIRKGLARFRDIIAKCTIAAQLDGRSKQTPVTTTVRALLQMALPALQPQLQTRNVTIRPDNSQTSIAVRDAPLLAYVMRTIFDNAITYSPDGGVIAVDVQDSSGSVVIAITDRGPGIPPARQSLLFQPFTKAEGAETFNHEGLGFSLYLDKLIMEYLGGSISLTSQPGETRVLLRIPPPILPSGPGAA